MKNILFPSKFRYVGMALFIVGLVIGACVMAGVPGVAASEMAHDAAVIGISVGALLTVCSREPYEDEMVSAIRLASLLNTLYASIIILVCSTLLLSGEEYQRFMELNLVLIPIIYVSLFRAEIYRYNKVSEDEE